MEDRSLVCILPVVEKMRSAVHEVVASVNITLKSALTPGKMSCGQLSNTSIRDGNVVPAVTFLLIC